MVCRLPIGYWTGRHQGYDVLSVRRKVEVRKDTGVCEWLGRPGLMRERARAASATDGAGHLRPGATVDDLDLACSIVRANGIRKDSPSANHRKNERRQERGRNSGVTAQGRACKEEVPELTRNGLGLIARGVVARV
jgi:hypothetical protein